MEEENFDIEKYINLLPDDINKINIRYKDITFIPNLSRFTCLEYLDCSNNKLTCLPNLPNSLIELSCCHNQLTCLTELPNSLEYLYCNNNKLTYLSKLPECLKYCNIINTNIINNIIYIINNIYNNINNKNIIKDINNKLSIYNRFRELYFALKFKKKFYKLYEKVIIKKYHPSNLIKLLENVEDDEEKMDILLNSW